jgi:hypothetical protein
LGLQAIRVQNLGSFPFWAHQHVLQSTLNESDGVQVNLGSFNSSCVTILSAVPEAWYLLGAAVETGSDWVDAGWESFRGALGAFDGIGVETVGFFFPDWAVDVGVAEEVVEAGEGVAGLGKVPLTISESFGTWSVFDFPSVGLTVDNEAVGFTVVIETSRLLRSSKCARFVTEAAVAVFFERLIGGACKSWLINRNFHFGWTCFSSASPELSIRYTSTLITVLNKLKSIRFQHGQKMLASFTFILVSFGVQIMASVDSAIVLGNESLPQSVSVQFS